MEGLGTQENPYKITTVQELRTVMSTNDAYGIVMNDLDCNVDKLDYWESIDGGSNSRFKEIDFNEHYLTNVLIKTGNCFYKSSVSSSATNKPTIKNGSIVNVYEDEASCFSDGISFIRMGFRIYAKTFSNPIFSNKTQMYLCNVEIENYNLRDQAWISGSGDGSGYYSYANTRFKLTGKIYNSMYSQTNNAISVKDCLFEGTLTGDTGDNVTLMGDTYASAMGCIFNINVKDINGFTRIGAESSYINIVNGEKIPDTIESTDTYVVFDEEDFYNPQKYNDIGFWMAEVK